MPYIHPDLGVPCMTISEFWTSEAKKTGQEAHELISDFNNSMAIEEQRASQDLLADKPGALKMLQDYYSPEYGDVEFSPVEIVNILTANVAIGMRSTSSTFTALVKCSDNKLRTLEYTESQYGGSYMEPPDFDCNCKVID